MAQRQLRETDNVTRNERRNAASLQVCFNIYFILYICVLMHNDFCIVFFTLTEEN